MFGLIDRSLEQCSSHQWPENLQNNAIDARTQALEDES